MSTPLHLLLVEDSEDDAFLVLRTLRRAGYDPMFERVETSSAMEDALERQAWDVIISDHSMPEFSSSTALMLLQHKGIDVPFIIVSGAIGEDYAVAAMKAGAHDYVTKDNLARLPALIERELREAEIRRERKRAQELTTRLSRILDNSPTEIYVFDAEALHFVQANQTAQQNIGYSLEELKHLTPLDLLPELREDQLARLLEPLRSGEQNQVMVEVRLRRKDGTTYLVHGPVHLSQSESPPVFAAIVTDITERRQAEHALQEARRTERDRIARDLHHAVLNDLVQVLDAMRVTEVRVPAEELRVELESEIASLQRAIQGLRNAIYNLRLE